MLLPCGAQRRLVGRVGMLREAHRVEVLELVERGERGQSERDTPAAPLSPN